GAVDEQPRGVELDRHVGQLPPNALKIADGATELLARAGVGERPLVRALGEAERDGGGAEPLAVVRAHQLLEAVAGTDQQVLAWHLAALEVQLSLRDAAQSHHQLAAADAESRRVTLDEQAADPGSARPLAESRVHQIEPRRAGARDPALVAVDPEALRRL